MLHASKKILFIFFRYEMSDKVISACHKLKAHLNDTKVLFNRELVSPHNPRKWKKIYILRICEKYMVLFINITVSSLGLTVVPTWVLTCGENVFKWEFLAL